jgi:hypothetical protein
MLLLAGVPIIHVQRAGLRRRFVNLAMNIYDHWNNNRLALRWR